MEKEPIVQVKIDNQIIQSIESLGKDKLVIFVAVDGGGGAGKSTFGQALVDQLHRPVRLVHVDDYCNMPLEHTPFTEDEVLYGNFDFARLKKEVMDDSTARGVIVVEGVGTLGHALHESFDCKIWLEAPVELRRDRGVRRDGQDWAYKWDERYLPEDEHYAAQQRPQDVADFIVRQ